MTDDIDECPNCGGTGKIGGCFEDTCVCDGDPEDPDFCCNPRRCDWCRPLKRIVKEPAHDAG